MPNFDEYYSRHYPLQSIGKENQLLLKYKRVLVIGLGGLGTVSSNLLVSLGIGKLRLVDYDVVEESNLARQSLYTIDDIGKAKVEVAAARLGARNPHVEIESIAMRVDPLNIEELLNGVDLVVDGLDGFHTRRVVFRAAYRRGIPFIFTGAVAESGNLMTFTHQDDSPCLYCVIGEMRDDPDMRCEILGVNPIILQILASFQVNEVLRVLTGGEILFSKEMLLFSIHTMAVEKILIKKNENCRFCSKTDILDTGKFGEVTKGLRDIKGYGRALITSLCGRNTFIFDPKWDMSWDFEEIMEIISNRYDVKVRGKNYITFKIGDAEISLIETGTATIRGESRSSNAVKIMGKLYSNILEKNKFELQKD